MTTDDRFPYLRAMRIAINTRFLLPKGLEGLGRYTYEICRRLVEQHPEHEYLFLFDRPFAAHYVQHPSVSGQVVRPPARHPFLWYAWFEWAIPSALDHWRADVFFSPDGYCSLRASTPTLMSVHDIGHHHFPEQTPWLVRNYYNHYVPKFVQRAERIAAVSEFTRQDIIQTYGAEERKTFVATNAGRETFVPLSEDNIRQVRQQYAGGEAYFFFVGAIHPRKNVHRLITAFDAFIQKTGASVKLLLAGRWAWQSGQVKDAYDAAQHKRQIKFLGFVEDEELAKMMGASLAVTLLSHFEGFGLPLVEAMQVQVPILCSDQSALPEVAGAGGLIVPPDDTQKITQAMIQLWQSPLLREQYVTAGQHELRRFSWDKSASKIIQALEMLGKQE